MIKIEIDGVEVNAQEGSSIIENADRLAIPIPRFCYHKKLSVAANCRMCLVQVEKSNKPLPACATPVVEGMKIWTNSKAAIAAQRAVMEFLLINHPLDCPICDQGGECELQDVSMNYGDSFSRYDQSKRTIYDNDLGPLIFADMTRCIHCTRCVRFGDEISGESELGATDRGEHMEIGTYIEQNLKSEVSGNIIDLCPVGALTSKPYRFKARAWELIAHPAIAVHDCIGANINLHVYNKIVKRVVPRENEEVNEIWLSDRDRFSYTGLQHEDRLRKPMLLRSDKWHVVSWLEALKYALAGLELVRDRSGVDQLGVLTSPNASCEELYLLQKFARSLGINNIDHRLRQLDFRDQDSEELQPSLGVKFKDLEVQDCVLLIGSNIHKEIPNAGLKLRKMVGNGGKLAVINQVDFTFNFPVANKQIAINLVESLQEILTALQDNTDHRIATQLKSGNRNLILLGHLALMHPRAAEIKSLSKQIATLVNAKWGCFTDGANAAGAWLTGCVPHRLPGGAATQGKNALQMLQEPRQGYILYALEPSFDSILGDAAKASLKEAAFVVVISAYQSDELLEIADVLLPLANFGEYKGTYINIDGKYQTNKAALPQFAESRPGWKILRVLANLAEFEGFNYTTEQEVLSEFQAIPQNLERTTADIAPQANTAKGIHRIAPIALYAVDPIVRRAIPLQQTIDAITDAYAQFNLATAQQLGIDTGDMVVISAAEHKIKLPVAINLDVADNSVLIYQAHINTNALPASYDMVEVEKC